MRDVIIIGAGVSGACCARELSRYKLDILVLEKEEDVCCGTSKANSAIVHAGFDAKPGSLMAKLNVEGNKMMEELCNELDIKFGRNGSLVLCHDEKDIEKLEELKQRGIKNGVKGLRIIKREELLGMEPNISDEAFAALYAPSAGIICPFELNIAMAENAFTNGVEFTFDCEVLNISKKEGFYELETSKGRMQTRLVVNAAGVYADKFHNMVSENKIHIIPRRGAYCLLDKAVGNHVNSTIFSLPDEVLGKGVLVTPTVDGNLLVGPTAKDIADKEGTNTTAVEISELTDKAKRNVKNLPIKQVITSFAGLRAHEDGGEFIVEELRDAPGFIDCAGIESPGLTSAPAIGIRVSNIVKGILNPERNKGFTGKREGILNPALLNIEERNKLIKQTPAYGNIVCRCEMVTEGEIIDAVKRPLGAKSLDGIKRRTRAGAGRCQAGFCSPKVIEILAREWDISQELITKSGGKSAFITGFDKDSL
jgi:hypothetical protein